MATISSSSGNAFDVPSLVSQLMANERQPITKLNTKISGYQTKISSFGTVKSLVSTFQGKVQSLNSALTQFSATPVDSTVLSASAASTAAAGVYSINVTTLAKAQRLASAGQLSDSTALTGAASTVTLTIGTTSTDISVSSGATLQDIRAAINAASVGVTATIVNDGSGTPYRLALSADSAGTSNAISSITVKTGGDSALNDLLAYNPTENAPSPLVPMAQTVPAANADFLVNGIRIQKSSNTISDAIQGVSLTLLKEGAASDVTVARSASAISTAASDFVDAYNAMASKLKSISSFGSGTAAGGALAGDGTVRMMQEQLRGIFTTPASGGSLTMLTQVGISMQADGSLKLDSSTLSTAVKNSFSEVSNLLSSASGFATRLDTWATSVTKSGGSIDERTASLNTSVKGINEQITQLEARMTILQKQYTNTYSKLNQLLNNMNSTSAYLTQQFSSKSS